MTDRRWMMQLVGQWRTTEAFDRSAMVFNLISALKQGPGFGWVYVCCTRMYVYKYILTLLGECQRE